MTPNSLFFVVNVDWFFLSHRLPLALAAQEKGAEVTIVTANTGRFDELAEYGFKTIEVPFERSGTNVIKELKVLFTLIRIYKKHKPDILHHVALKASAYGSVAARIAGAPLVVNALSGLGYLFTASRKSFAQRSVLWLMGWGFRFKNNRFIFQNPDDFELLEDLNFVNKNNSAIIKGSGIDLNDFLFTPPVTKDKLQIVLPARMLKDKGVVEFINAAKLAKEQLHGRCEWLLCGGTDKENPTGLSANEVKEMLDGDYIQWLGHKKDMKDVFIHSDIVVLPSYREGLPKALIEACAIGRPIVTTDTPGCRECVEDGVNGFLVPVKDYELLAKRVTQLILDEPLRLEFGKKSRSLAEKEFSIQKVVDKTLTLYKQ